jgi:hypothetical protein
MPLYLLYYIFHGELYEKCRQCSEVDKEAYHPIWQVKQRWARGFDSRRVKTRSCVHIIGRQERRVSPLTHSLMDSKLRGITSLGVPSLHLADLWYTLYTHAYTLCCVVYTCVCVHVCCVHNVFVYICVLMYTGGNTGL